MLDIGVPLEPPERLHARRQRQPDERQKRDEKRKPEGAEHGAMEQWRQDAPQLQKRHHEEGADDNEGPEQRLPDALAEERKPAETHPALEAPAKRAILGPLFGALLWVETRIASSALCSTGRKG